MEEIATHNRLAMVATNAFSNSISLDLSSLRSNEREEKEGDSRSTNGVGLTVDGGDGYGGNTNTTSHT